MDTSTNNSLWIAGAIVVAGVIIGIAVSTSGGGGTRVVSGTSALAAEAGADVDAFEACMNDSGRFADLVSEDYSEAIAAGGTGTPFNVYVLQEPLSRETQALLTGSLNTVFRGDAGVVFDTSGMHFSVGGALPVQVIENMYQIATGNADQKTLASIEPVPPTTGDIPMRDVSSDEHVRGNADASFVIVEFSDLDCPFCAQFHQTMKSLLSQYTPEEMAWVYRHFPLDSIHPDAREKARLSECVADLTDNDGFWTFVDGLFAES